MENTGWGTDLCPFGAKPEGGGGCSVKGLGRGVSLGPSTLITVRSPSLTAGHHGNGWYVIPTTMPNLPPASLTIFPNQHTKFSLSRLLCPFLSSCCRTILHYCWPRTVWVCFWPLVEWRWWNGCMHLHLHVFIAWKCSVQTYKAVIVCARLFRYNCAMMDGAALDWSHACPHKGALWRRLCFWRWREIVCVCVCVGWGLEKEGMGLICNRMITGWPAALAQHVHLVLFQKHLCKGTMNCMFLVNSLKFM